MFSNEEIARRLAELNEAWHTAAQVADNHTMVEMQRAVERLDAAQNWFKVRNIKLDYDRESGDHSLSAEQLKWRRPGSHSQSSYASYFNGLQRMRGKSYSCAGHPG